LNGFFGNDLDNRKWILDSSGSRQGPVVGPCEDGNEPLSSIKSRVFLD